jgi:hypothetical protein
MDYPDIIISRDKAYEVGIIEGNLTKAEYEHFCTGSFHTSRRYPRKIISVRFLERIYRRQV